MRNEIPTRFRRARASASLRTLQKRVEQMLGFPPGSVQFVHPSGRKARTDSSAAALRRKWEG